MVETLYTPYAAGQHESIQIIHQLFSLKAK
jgi:hypothetical protein